MGRRMTHRVRDDSDLLAAKLHRQTGTAPGKTTRTAQLRPAAAAARPAPGPARTPSAAASLTTAQVHGLVDAAVRPHARGPVVQGKFGGAARGADPGGGDSRRDLPAPVRARMGQSLGHDLAGVRVFEGPEASRAGAQAFARGDEIHFAPGQYDPGSRSGLELIGHELAHVTQQAQGRVGATTMLGKGLAVNDDPGLEREADLRGAAAAAHALEAAPAPAAPAALAPLAAAAPVVQGKFLD